MTVVIARVQNTLVLTSPYHPALLKPAKDLGGKWNGAAWVFDPRDEERVRALCVQVYGTDGSPQCEADLVSVRLTAQKDVHSEYREALYVAGRSIVYALHRDSGGKMSPGTVKLSGNVYSRGSARNWYVSVEKDTVLEVRDIPRAVLAGISQDDWVVEIVDEKIPAAAVLPGDESLQVELTPAQLGLVTRTLTARYEALELAGIASATPLSADENAEMGELQTLLVRVLHPATKKGGWE